MFVRMTFVKFKAGTAEATQKLYNEVVIPAMTKQPGLRFVHLLERTENPDEAISITAWDSREDAERYEATGVYQQLVGRFNEFYAAPPELRSYEVTVSSDPIIVRMF